VPNYFVFHGFLLSWGRRRRPLWVVACDEKATLIFFDLGFKKNKKL